MSARNRKTPKAYSESSKTYTPRTVEDGRALSTEDIDVPPTKEGKWQWPSRWSAKSDAPLVDPDSVGGGTKGKEIFCKVPAGGVYFWVIMAFCTPVGETLADTVNETLGLGLQITSVSAFALLIVSLLVQFSLKKYTPPVYWWLDVVISACGTCMCDGLSDAPSYDHGLGIPTGYSAAVFFPILLMAFGSWYYIERSIDIHSIYTVRRDMFYWLAVLCCFAFGTTMGDFISEVCELGYGYSALVYLAWVLFWAGLWNFAVIPEWAGFWLVYLFNRPLGSNIADLLTNEPDCDQYIIPANMPAEAYTTCSAPYVVSLGGENCTVIAPVLNITVDALEALNPEADRDGLIPDGTTLCGLLDSWVDPAGGDDSVCVGVVDKWHWGYSFNRVTCTFIFLGLIVAVVAFLTYTKVDVLTPMVAGETNKKEEADKDKSEKKASGKLSRLVPTVSGGEATQATVAEVVDTAEADRDAANAAIAARRRRLSQH